MDSVTKQGYGPLHPFQAFEYERFEGGPIGREKTIEFCRRLVDVSDEFWIFGVSKGTLEELNHALKIGKPVRLFLKEFDNAWEEYYQKLELEYGRPLDAFL